MPNSFARFRSNVRGLLEGKLSHHANGSPNQELLKKLNSLKAEVSGKDAMLVELFVFMVGRFLETKYIDDASVTTKAVELGLSTSSFNRVVKALNHDILYGAELEYTSHGLRRSFRFMGVDEKRSNLLLASRVAGALRSEFGNVAVGYGLVLGLTRNGDMIAHDDDIDVLVAVEPHQHKSITSALAHLSLLCQSRGLYAYGTWAGHRKVSVYGGSADVDVFVGMAEGGTLSFIPGGRKSVPFDAVFPPVFRELHGVSLPFPRDPRRYLESVYGPAWNVPDPSWRHNWDTSAFTDILHTTLEGYPFQATALAQTGARYAVVDAHNTLIATCPNPLRVVDLSELGEMEKQAGIAVATTAASS